MQCFIEFGHCFGSTSLSGCAPDFSKWPQVNCAVVYVIKNRRV